MKHKHLRNAISSVSILASLLAMSYIYSALVTKNVNYVVNIEATVGFIVLSLIGVSIIAVAIQKLNKWIFGSAVDDLHTEPSIATEPIIALRIWRAHDLPTTALLQSWISNTLWPHGVALVAENNEGIHAFNNTASLIAYQDNFDKMPASIRKMVFAAQTTVIGSVALWGEITESEYGYTAEYGYPSHVVIFDGNERLATKLRNAYGCTVTAISSKISDDNYEALCESLLQQKDTETTTRRG